MDASARRRARNPGTNRVRGRGCKRDGGVEVFRPKVWLREELGMVWYGTFQKFRERERETPMGGYTAYSPPSDDVNIASELLI